MPPRPTRAMTLRPTRAMPPRRGRASEIGFLGLKVTGAWVLVWLGVQSLRHARRPVDAVPPRSGHRPFVDGPRVYAASTSVSPLNSIFCVSVSPVSANVVRFVPRGLVRVSVSVSPAHSPRAGVSGG